MRDRVAEAERGKRMFGSKQNSKMFEISVPSELYSSAADSMLHQFGFRIVGAGAGSYEYMIEANNAMEVKEKLKRIWVSIADISVFKL